MLKFKFWLFLFSGSFLLVLLDPIDDAYSDVRKDRFSKRADVRQFIAFGGNYQSDQNSREYEISAKYEYKSDRFMNEFNFLRNVTKAETKTIPMRKTKDLYDSELSGKVLISSSDYYFSYYNRSKYDDFSIYGHDVVTTAGFGKLFLNQKVELGLNLGWNDVKYYDSDIVINPTLQLNLDLTDRIRLVTRGFIYKRGVNFDGIKNYSEQLRSSLSFKLDKNLYFEMVHYYDKNRYVNKTSKYSYKVTDVNRTYLARIKYEF